MPTLVMNKVAGAELTATSDVRSAVQIGHVDDIDIEGLSDPEVLVKVQQFLEGEGYTFGIPLGQDSGDLRYTRLRVKTEMAKWRRANVELTYESNSFNATPTVYLLRDRSFAMQQTRCTIPGSRIPLVCEYRIGSPTDPFSQLISDMVFYTFDVTARSIQLVVFQYGRPNNGGMGDLQNHVNHAPWPTGTTVFNGQSMPVAGQKPKGYWKTQGYMTEYDRNKGMTLTQTDVLTQGIEDWSVVGMLKNEQTGKYPFASLDLATRIKVYNEVFAAEYDHAIIYPTDTTPTRDPKGIQRVGPFPMTDFTQILNI